jgi:peptidoglycan/LPS O-acetylase OafA/YrhL
MNPVLSRYLDVVRFGAAMVVVLYHAWPIFFPAHALPWPGHDAVVVFFVMSGLVIAYVVDRRRGGVWDYALDRLTRLWSVAVPALLIACLLRLSYGPIGIGDVAPAIRPAGDFARNTLANLFFLADGWGVYWQAPLNGPFWSLNYEAWYYAIFAAFMFAGRRCRWWCAAALAAAAGPKLLLLLPCWLAGVVLYHARPAFSARLALLLFMASLLAYAAFFWFDVGNAIRAWMFVRWPERVDGLALSGRFVGDYICALIVVVNFAAAANLGRYARLLFWGERPIRACASLTLSIYLYHMPLTALVYAGLGLRAWWAPGIVALMVCGLGVVTERSRWRLRAALQRIVFAPRVRGEGGGGEGGGCEGG